MFQTKAIEEIITHILCSLTHFRKLCGYEIIWKNIVEWSRPQMTNGTHALHAGYLRLQTHTHICNTAFPLPVFYMLTFILFLYITCIVLNNLKAT